MTVLLVVLEVVVLALVALALLRKPPADARTAEQAARLQAGVGELGAQVAALHGQLAGAVQGLTGTVQAVREDSRVLVTERFEAVRAELGQTLRDQRRETAEALERVQERIARQLGEIRESVQQRLGETLDRNAAVFKDVTDRLGDLKVTNERIVAFSQDLNSLQSILQSPKLRGNLGEFALETMLRQVLPPDVYRLQASLGGAERVDAVIDLREGKLPIDSKFPLEAWRRLKAAEGTEEEPRARKAVEQAVRTHVDSIATKYIMPPVTLEFALMFIPAEGVFYEIQQDAELRDYALSRRVVAVSPSTLFAHLQVVALGFRGMKIEQEARRVEKILGELKRSFDGFKDHFAVVGKHLENARKQYEVAQKDVTRFDATIGGLRLGDIDEAEVSAAPVPLLGERAA